MAGNGHHRFRVAGLLAAAVVLGAGGMPFAAGGPRAESNARALGVGLAGILHFRTPLEAPESPPSDAWVERAKQWEEEGSLYDAMMDYSMAIALEPNRVQLWRLRAEACKRWGDPDGAARDYGAVIALEPNNARTYFERGMIFRLRDETASAIRDYDKAVALDPRDYWTFYDRASCHRSRGDFEKAVADFTRAIEIDPKERSGYLQRASTLETWRKKKRAADDYDAAADRTTSDYDQFFYRAVALRLRGEPNAALEAIARAAEICADEVAIPWERGLICLEANRGPEALKDFDKIIKLRPDSSDAFNCRAEIWRMMKDYDRAMRDYDRALEIRPGDDAARLNRAEVHWIRKEPWEAYHDYRKVQELRPADPRLLCPLGSIRREMGDLAGSRKLLDQAVAKDPNDPECYVSRAATCVELREYDQAWEDVQSARRLGDDAEEHVLERLQHATGRRE